VSVYYDPMIAKLVVWDSLDRESALRRLRVALEQFHVVGLHTNLPFLRKLSAHAAFEEGKVETGFIAKYQSELIPPVVPASPHFVALAALAALLQDIPTHPASPHDPHSPWNRATSLRLNSTATRTVRLLDSASTGQGKTAKDAEIKVGVVDNKDNTHTLTFGKHIYLVRGQLVGDKLSAHVGDAFYQDVIVVNHDGELVIFHQGISASFRRPSPVASKTAESNAGSLLSPMPGKIVKVFVKVGDSVNKGAPLVIMEAMKMEHTIRAPTAGVVESIRYNVGDIVEEKKILVTLTTQQ